MLLVGGQVHLEVEEPHDEGVDLRAGEVREGGGEQAQHEVAHVLLVGLVWRLLKSKQNSLLTCSKLAQTRFQ